MPEIPNPDHKPQTHASLESSELWLRHPIGLRKHRLLRLSLSLTTGLLGVSALFLALGDFRNAEEVVERIHLCLTCLVVRGIDFQSTKVSILAVLVIFDDLDLDEECSQGIAIRTTTYSLQVDVNPSLWLVEFKIGEWDEIMVASSTQHGNTSWRVGLIGFEVKEETDSSNGSEAGEMDVKVMRLGSIRSI